MTKYIGKTLEKLMEAMALLDEVTAKFPEYATKLNETEQLDHANDPMRIVIENLAQEGLRATQEAHSQVMFASILSTARKAGEIDRLDDIPRNELISQIEKDHKKLQEAAQFLREAQDEFNGKEATE